MRNFIITILLSLPVLTTAWSQNIGINSTGNAPDQSAGLDVDFTDKGVLIPRVALIETTNTAPITTPATALLVYNTANINDVTPGFYYWDGTVWTRIGAGTGYWDRDAVNEYLFPSNINDNVGIGTNTPAARLDADSGTEDISVRGIGRFGPTRGYLGVQGNTGFDGIGTLDINGNEIGVVGLSTGTSSTDNYGVYGHSNGWGGRFEYEDGNQFVEMGGNTYAIRIVDGTEGTGKVLTSIDNNGNAIWKEPGCKDVQSGFESGLGLWSSAGGDGNWETNSGTTSSTSTGPSSANEGTSYAYCETSGSSGGDLYILETEQVTCENPSISFDYHMYFNGNTDGTLELEVSTDGGATWINIWSQTGDQGNAWQNQNVNLNAYASQSISLRFAFTTGTAGSTFQYDCALDDINLIDVNPSAGGSTTPDDDWQRAGPLFVRTMNDDDSVLVGSGAGPTYPYDFAVDNGSASGTNIGIGSIEYFTDEASETTINNRFSPADDAIEDLGSTGQRWAEVFAANGVINTSDRRDKKDIESLSYGLEEIMQLEPVSFNWKDHLSSPDQKGKKKIGLIAQELHKVVPEVVKTKDYIKIGENPDTEEPIKEVQEAKRWGVFYADLIPVLIKALQEEDEKVEALKAQIETQNDELNTLNQQQDEVEALKEQNAKQQALIEELSKRLEKLESED